MNIRGMKAGIASACVVLAACGGGSDTMTAGIDARGGPATAGVVSRGAITGFGSIIVNGVRFDTSASSFEIDGSSGTQADLSVGDVVTVRGTVDADGINGTASSVTFDDVVEGPVSAVDLVASTITVLGQLVVIDADTSFDDSISPPSIDGIAVGDIVEVSGLRRADGSIGATRIEAKPAGGEFEVTGTVSDLSGTTFQIESLVVDFSGAMLFDFPGGGPANGDLVEARGTMLGPNDELIADRVELKNDLQDVDVQIEIEGFITRFVSSSDFDVAGFTVAIDGSTVFEFGSIADLSLNSRIEVEGVVDANGVIVATRITIKPAGSIRIEGLVDAVDASSVTMFGVRVDANAATRIEDKSSADMEPFALSDINVGDYLETRAFESAGDVVATRIEREDFDNEVAIRAFVDSVADPSFTLLGVNIETNGATEFRDRNNQVISAADFFAAADGRLVEAEGTPSNGGILAEDVEFED